METPAATATTAGDIVYADAANSMGSRVGIGAAGSLLVANGTAPLWRLADESVTTTDNTTTSTTYEDLDNGGGGVDVIVTATTGTVALAMWWARVSCSSAGGLVSVSVDVSGATTDTASDGYRIQHESNAADDIHTGMTFRLFSSLSAGSNTFTLQHKTSTGTGTTHEARLVVLPLS